MEKSNEILWDTDTPITENRIYIMENGKAKLFSVSKISNKNKMEKEIGNIIECKHR
ncbi:hypothetical protein PIROE2DRAFT_8060 [Piromyces sp. E2]|nr:hypothetical protein PIROE2DRAFT_8060 [Piromyces sp. E2]|eukprot:OUM64997.1 hypothetical protein PIROE2DRAFT_8060 [Piromyces sp. E2]